MTLKPSTVVVRTLVVLGLLAAGWLRQPVAVGAKAGITVTSPSNGAVLRAGPDFATDVLADPWDFNNREDVSMDPAQIRDFTSFAFAGGKVTARATGGTNFFATLQRAYYGILNPGRTGRRFPIDPSVYAKLSFKMSATSGNQFPRVYWFHNDLGHPAGDGYGWRYIPENGVPSPAGTRTYVVNMTQFNNPDPNQPGLPWSSGAVKGFAIYPNNTNAINDVTFDWVRLTTPDGHPASATTPVSWTGGTGTASITVTDAQGDTVTVATNQTTPYAWNHGVLPPGSYTLTISEGGLNGTVSFTVNTPPLIQVTDPDETGGEDFATTVLGNAWDMNDSADIRKDVNIVDHLISSGFSNGRYTGTSDGVTVAFSGAVPVGDPQAYFLSNQKDVNPTPFIDTSRYHRLTFGLTVDRAFDLERGSVARVFWGSASSASGGGTPYDLTTTKDIITFPGVPTFSVDLAPLNSGPDGGLEVANATGWPVKNVRHFRIDPHEFAEQVTFHYDFVKLAADDETTNGNFTIHFTGSDPDAGAAPTVALFYDTDTDPSAGLTAITSGLSLASGQYVWNTSQVPAGTYYIRAVVSDGLNQSARYSSGPVKVSSFTPPSNPLISVDAPASGAVVTSAFEVGGWALDTAASSGSGIDAVQFYVFPNGGADPGVFVGSGTYGAARTDVGAMFGSQFTNSGFHFTITGMGPGNYVLGVYARSTVTNTFSAVKLVPITVNANALMSIDVPAPEATVTSRNFAIAGWAIDRQAPSGVGVDAIHMYAYHNPGSGEAPVFLGVGTLGIARSDVAALYGSRYTNSGYVLQVDWNALGLGAGLYNLVAVAHSTATGTFNNLAVVQVRIQ